HRGRRHCDQAGEQPVHADGRLPRWGGAVARTLALAAAVLFATTGGGGASSPTASPSLSGDAGNPVESGSATTSDGGALPADASYTIGDASVSASRFVTSVVSFTPTH